MRPKEPAHVEADLGEDDAAPRLLMPGIEINSSMAARKGPRLPSTSASILAMAASRASI